MLHSPGNRLARELEYAKAAAGTEHETQSANPHADDNGEQAGMIGCNVSRTISRRSQGREPCEQCNLYREQ